MQGAFVSRTVSRTLISSDRNLPFGAPDERIWRQRISIRKMILSIIYLTVNNNISGNRHFSSFYRSRSTFFYFDRIFFILYYSLLYIYIYITSRSIRRKRNFHPINQLANVSNLKCNDMVAPPRRHQGVSVNRACLTVKISSAQHFEAGPSFVGSPVNEPITDQRSTSILITSSGIEHPGLLPLVVVLMERVGAWLLSVQMGHYRRWFKQVQFSDHLIVKLRGKEDTGRLNITRFPDRDTGDDYI